jgi:O-antigen ligase
MSLMQAILLGLIALIITPGYFFYFDVTPKTVVLLLGSAALLLAARKHAAPRLFSALILANIASALFSTAISTRPGLSVTGTGWREFGLASQVAALALAWTISGSPASRAVLRGVVVAGIGAGAYGISQYFGWDPFLPAAAYHVGEGIWTIVRPPGTMGYVSYFAAWLVMAAFLSLALAEKESSIGWRRAALVSAGICAAAMLLTGTRAAMLGLACGALAWVAVRGVSRRTAALAALAALGCAAFYFSPAGWNLRSRARWFAEDPTGGGRVLLWRDTVRMGAARPLTGFGPETFTAEFAKYESEALARQRPDFEYESPHNMFLDAFAGQGTPGLVALAALCGMALFAGFTAREAGLTAALAAGIVTQQFSAMTIPTAVTLYAACALLAERMPWSANRATAPAAIRIPLAVALAVCAIPLVMSERLLAEAQSNLKAGDAASAAQRFDRYRQWTLPGTATADLWYARASLELAERTHNGAARLIALTRGRIAAEKAPDTAEDPFNAWYTLAEFDALSGDASSAERDLRRAIAARPNWFKPHWTIAKLLLLQGRSTEAETEASLAAWLDGGKDTEVTRTLTEVQGRLRR